MPVLAAAIGIYLPLDLMVPIFLGGLLAHFVEKRHGIVGTHDESLRDRVHRKGVLFSAGLITGEALMGIVIAIPIVLSERADVLALPAAFHFGQLRRPGRSSPLIGYCAVSRRGRAAHASIVAPRSSDRRYSSACLSSLRPCRCCRSGPTQPTT